MNFSLHSSRHPKSLINLPLKKVLINFLFSVLTDNNDDSVEAITSSSKKRKLTHSDDEQILINSTSKWKDDTIMLDTTVGSNFSTGVVSKPRNPKKIKNQINNINAARTLRIHRV